MCWKLISGRTVCGFKCTPFVMEFKNNIYYICWEHRYIILVSACTCVRNLKPRTIDYIF